MSLRTLRIVFCFALFLGGFNLGWGQVIGDFGTIASGTYTDATIWRQWDGVGWNTVPATYPNGSTQNVFIRTGHTVTLPAPGPYNAGNLNVEAGGKLFTNNPVNNVYISVWGTNIVCDGEIGNGAAFDGIAFNIDGPNCTITGIGTFTASRIRKNSTNNTTTLLVVATDVTLRWDINSNIQFYNNIASGAANFNLTINAGCTLNCEGSPGNPGNFSMDGINGTSAASAGGQISVEGTLIIPGTMFATTNNTSTTNTVYLLVKTGGLLRVGQINSPASGTGLSRITVQNGGKLELTGIGFPVGTANWSTTNNRYDFAVGSTVEFSAPFAQTVPTPTDFTAVTLGNNQYYHLILSGSGNKTIRTSLQPLIARGNITITGNAVFDQDANDVDIQVGGNWTNYNASGFLESTSLLKSVRFFGNNFAVQDIFCPGGEQFQNLVIAKSISASGAKVRMLSPVTVNNQLSLGIAGASVTYGILELNQNALTLNRSDSAAIRLQGPAGYYRYIIAEDPAFGSIVKWNIGTSTGVYGIPFGISSSTDTIPFGIAKFSSADIGTFSVSTYGTPANNLPWPSGPVNVSNLNSVFPANNTPDNRDWTVDRFWYIGGTNYVAGISAGFLYNNRIGSTSELPANDQNSLNLKAQYWNSAAAGWMIPQLGIGSTPLIQPAGVGVLDLPVFNTAYTLTSISSPLPVEWLSFTAEPNGTTVALKWSTATETNCDRYVVERSVDGYSFERIGSLPGSGTSSSLKSYAYNDRNPLNGLAYYRIRQVDYNGQYSLSEPVSITMKGAGKGLLYPIPANNRLNWKPESTDNNPNPVVFRVYSAIGSLVETLQGMPIDQSYSLDISHLSSGSYLLRIEQGANIQCLPFAVARP